MVYRLMRRFDVFKQHVLNSGISVFTMSETWLTKQVSNCLLDIQGYNLLCLDRSWGSNRPNQPKRGGGLGIYIMSNLNYSDTELERLNRSDANIECQWITIKQENLRKIIICNVYRPPQWLPL